ncbi:unnamed protein product [marine sediment metagenome]|uniref:Uncharacterized protein n=1 Tax=marine sediment metagenome TaxID=412755 RepID=X1RKZ8_9ZZZZ
MTMRQKFLGRPEWIEKDIDEEYAEKEAKKKKQLEEKVSEE